MRVWLVSDGIRGGCSNAVSLELSNFAVDHHGMHGVFRRVSVTNVNTSSEFTMTSRVLNLTGSATLDSLGTLQH